MADTRAFEICRELIRGGTAMEQIDAGVYYIDRRGEKPIKKVYPETADDGTYQSQECYAQAIREAEDDMRAYGRLLLIYRRSPNAQNWNELVKFKKLIDEQHELGRFKREIPFFYTDFNPFTRDDDEIFASLLEKIHEIEMPADPASHPEELTNYIRKLETILTAPKSEGGFGIVPTPFSTPKEPTANDREQTAIQSIESGYGDCSEFALAYYGMYIMMSPTLEPLIISAPWDDEPGYRHLRMGLKQAGQDGKNVTIVDPAGMDDSVRPLREDEVEITPLQLMAIYFKNRALDSREGTSKRKRKSFKLMIQTASRYDPEIQYADE